MNPLDDTFPQARCTSSATSPWSRSHGSSISSGASPSTRSSTGAPSVSSMPETSGGRRVAGTPPVPQRQGLVLVGRPLNGEGGGQEVQPGARPHHVPRIRRRIELSRFRRQLILLLLMKIVYMFFIMLIHQSHSHVLSPAAQCFGTPQVEAT